MTRATKIVATLGPASSSPEVLERLIRAGVDVVRMNFSHGKPEDHVARANLVRDIASRANRSVGILADLQGPKIRVGKFKDGKVTLKNGEAFVLDADCLLGDEKQVGIDYKELARDVKPRDVLLLNDGLIVFEVKAVRGNRIECIVQVGGVLSNNKGINRKGGGLTAPPLTAKDMDDIKTAVARELMRAAGGHALLIAKIERSEAVTPEALRDIMKDCDGIMVARGDLAVEVGDAAVPALQKRMIRLAREMNKLTITATQMMESMVTSPIPTRAEVSDVANAVLDGTDAVMLSAESASGSYPVEAVEAMVRVCKEAEKSAENKLDREFLDRVFTRVDQSIAMAALFTAHHLKVRCIAALTQSGSTALWMSRLNSGVPIYALTPEAGTLTKTALMRDVQPFTLAYEGHDREKLMQSAEQVLLDNGVADLGDIVVITMGEPIGQSGGTNTMKIVKLGENRPA
jgi:pyruvate kinase